MNKSTEMLTLEHVRQQTNNFADYDIIAQQAKNKAEQHQALQDQRQQKINQQTTIGMSKIVVGIICICINIRLVYEILDNLSIIYVIFPLLFIGVLFLILGVIDLSKDPNPTEGVPKKYDGVIPLSQIP